MSEEQARFFDELLAKYPRLQEFWDRDERQLKDDMVLAMLFRLSQGEQVALKALVSIWLGKAPSGCELDLTDLAALSPEWRAPLVQWILNPFWP